MNSINLWILQQSFQIMKSNQLDLFEQPLKNDQTKYYVTWEEKKLNAKDLHWWAASKIKTTCRPMPRNEMLEFIEFLKSCHSYCGWHHIIKEN